MSGALVRRAAETGAGVVDDLDMRRRGRESATFARGERKPELTALALAVVGAAVRHWADGPTAQVAAGKVSRRRRKRQAILVVPGMYAPSHPAANARRDKGSRRWLRRSVVGGALALGLSKVREILDEDD